MRTRLRAALLVTVAAGLAFAMAAPASASGAASWSADLAAGQATGVVTGPDGVALDADRARTAPAEGTTAAGTTGGMTGGMTEGTADADPSTLVPTGLLTLAPRTLPRPAARIDSTVVGDLPEGSTATVDVRGRRANGNWTEWVPSTPVGTTEGTRSSTALPAPATQVQSRLVLTGTEGAEPVVTDLRQTAVPAAITPGASALTETAPSSYQVFATREGLVGGTTANGHVITERDHFVALPSRRALSPRGTTDYSVKVCAANGRCAFAPVWDVGPWNTRDDYWNPGTVRQNWGDLAQGTPEARAAYRDGYNGGHDQFGRKVLNPAGIDLADGVFWDDLGLKDNSTVTVDYLWTGSVTLSKVAAETATVQLRSGPSTGSEVIGSAAHGASVPVVCSVGTGPDAWLQVGTGQYLPAAAVPGAGAPRACDAAG